MAKITERRGRDENRCSGSGLSEHFISGVRDVGRDCRPPREPTALVHHYYRTLRLVHTWLHSRDLQAQWTRAASRSGHASRFLEHTSRKRYDHFT